MSPIRSIFRAILCDAVDFDYGESAEWFGSKCLFCEDYTQDGVHLEMQIFGLETVYIMTQMVNCGYTVAIA